MKTISKNPADSRVSLLFLCCVLALPGDCFAAPEPSSFWSRKASVTWSGTALRDSCIRFAEARKIGFFLDRRIDPARRIEFEATTERLDRIFLRLAESLDLGCFFFEKTVYIGPRRSAERMPLLLEEHQRRIRSLPNREKARWSRKISWKIDFLAEPKQLLQNIAIQNGMTWDDSESRGLDRLPHDLWNETFLPDMSLDELLTLVLTGFEMDFKLDDNTLYLVSIPEPVSKENRKDDSTEEKHVKLSNREDTAEKRKEEQLSEKIPLSRRRFTIKVENQRLDRILDALTDRLGLKLELDEPSLAAKNISLEQSVSFEAKNATAGELFRIVLRPLKLDFRIQGDTISIR